MRQVDELPQLTRKQSIAKYYKGFIEALEKAGFKGESAASFADRLVAATDNSIYQVLPEAVLFPRSSRDVQIIMEVADQSEFSNIKIAPRGGATGTNGQSLNNGVQIDFSRHMDTIEELNLQDGWVRVQPGVVLDQLNDYLRPHGYCFAPNLSPSSRATLGGMVATDACGKGSRIYGRTSNHVIELDLVLTDGANFRLRSQSREQVDTAKGPGTDAMRAVYNICVSNRDDILDDAPKLQRFITGYNLAHTVDDNGDFHPQYLLAGSEGTLAITTSMVLKITALPKSKAMLLVKYGDFDAALRDANQLLSLAPHAIETIDDTILKLARNDIIWSRVGQFFPEEDPESISAINILEFYLDSNSDPAVFMRSIKEKLDGAESQSQNPNRVSCEVVTDAGEMASLWDLRKKGVGLLGNQAGQRKPVAFVEDTGVAPEHLADYILEFRRLLNKHGLSYGMFGHVDVGCLHVRPALDLKDPRDELLMEQLSHQVKKLVQKYNGLMWAEHGRGYRSEFTADFFGARVYPLLRQVKKLFDPNNKLNPGKIVTPSGSKEEVPKLHQVPMRGQRDRVLSEAALGRFGKAVDCNGNGACFSYDTNYVMCPSLKYRRDRVHSPKGRAAIMREWLSQISDQGVSPERIKEANGRHQVRSYDFSHEVYDAMDGCLSCKACSNQCPIKVDIPELKSQFLSIYHSRYKRPATDRMIAYAELMHSHLRRVGWLYNLFACNFVGRFVAKAFFGMVDPPRLSWPPLEKRLEKQRFPLIKQRPAKTYHRNSVIIVQDAMTSFYEADLVIDCLKLIRSLGYRPVVSRFQPNGKSFHVKGFRSKFRKVASANVDWLKQMAASGVPMVGFEPAITLSYREEYKTLAEEVPVHLVHEWLGDNIDSINPASLPERRHSFVLLSHCGEQTSAAGKMHLWKKIFAKFDQELELIPVGCCGMAGAFGHEKRHLEESRGIFALSWQGQVQAALDAGKIPLATGASCRTQVKRFMGEKILHPLQALAAVLAD